MSHTASLWHEISSQEKKLGEQMIPIIRKPTVLITIPRTTEPPPSSLPSRSPRHPPSRGPAPAHSSQPLALPGTLPWHCRSKGDASPAAHFMPHSISQGLNRLPSLLPFLFPPPCFFCLDLWRLLCSSSWGTSRIPNAMIPKRVKAWMFATLELDWNLTA